ncbi:MAG: zinc-dependent metalloprotease [Actinobacteria bacterium]|nr:zinc-dependent metalloprotease [Actinomycetota bacterium]
MAGFGFTPDDPNDPNNSGRPDFEAMMRQMQEQMKAQFEQLGINPAGFVNPFTSLFSQVGKTNSGKDGEEVLSITTARDTATKFVKVQGLKPLGTKDVSVVENAFEISELWLNEATSFPASTHAPMAVSRMDWVLETMPGWHKTIEPLAAGLSSAISDLMDQAMNAQAADPEQGQPPIEMITAMLRSFIGTMIATQLGQSIGTLATSVTGAHDVGLPLLDPARAIVIPENIENWAVDLEIAKSEVFIFHALREGAVARLFAHNPWLVSYIQSAVVEYGKCIHIDIDAIQRQAQEAFEGMQANMPEGAGEGEAISFALDNGIFTPEESPAQKSALLKLETVLALIDGWTDEVVSLAAGDRIPSIEQLRESHRRRRASSSPAQQLFSSMLGLQVSPKLTREASAFWKKIREVKSVGERDQIWSGLLPTADDLLDPEKFLTSTSIPDDLSGLL